MCVGSCWERLCSVPCSTHNTLPHCLLPCAAELLALVAPASEAPNKSGTIAAGEPAHAAAHACSSLSLCCARS